MRQITIKRLLILPIVCIFLLLLICCNASESNQPSPPSPSPAIISTPVSVPVTKPSPPPAPALPIPDQLYKEANELANEHFKKYVVKCNDTYFWKTMRSNDTGAYVAFAGKGEPVVKVDGRYFPPKILSTAEKLNKVDPQPIEWDGTATLHFEAVRIVACGNCGSYEKIWRQDDKIYPISKVKGKWKMGAYQNYETRFLPFKCSDAPSDLNH